MKASAPDVVGEATELLASELFFGEVIASLLIFAADLFGSWPVFGGFMADVSAQRLLFHGVLA